MGAMLPKKEEAQASPKDQGLSDGRIADLAWGAAKATDCFHVPVANLVEYRNKGDRDFSRLDKDAFEALVLSMKTSGQWDPLIVRPIPSMDQQDDVVYEILAGENRWRAAQELKWDKVLVRVVKGTDEEAEAIFAGTNYFRREMTLRDKIIGASRYMR